MEPILLASGSPRRQELLTRVGIPFEVDAPDVDESCDLPAREAVLDLSRRKALAGAALHPGRYVLAADTLVELDGQAIGKPKDPADALRMLRLLSGRTHRVHTGVTVVSPTGALFTRRDTSSVTFCSVPDPELQAYVRTGDPLDKAGAYAQQGRPSLWITHLEGCDSSVMGLPLYLVRELLLEAGYEL